MQVASSIKLSGNAFFFITEGSGGRMTPEANGSQ